MKKKMILIVIIGLMILYTLNVLFGKSLLEEEYIANYLDGELTDKIPSKNESVFTKAVCDNDVNISWNDEEWGLFASNLSKKSKCNLYFQTIKDVTKPELYQGFIPVVYDDTGNILIADENSLWYDYENHKWGNAVLVNCSDTTVKNKYFDSNMNLKPDMVGQIIDMNDILQMYVWIPRYRYRLWNAENGVSDEQMINIIFESTERPKANGNKNGEYLTHPAFTFGDTELSGIWIGKFEMTGTTDLVTIKPNLKSLVNINISTMFNLSRSFSTTSSSTYGLNSNDVDSHMMKNMDWGAVAYLTNSKYGRYLDENNCIESGCTPWINSTLTDEINKSDDYGNHSRGYFITGCSGTAFRGDVYISSICQDNYDWKNKGVNAATTGNIFGIYDMNGGAFEYVMGVMLNQDSTINYGNSGFSGENMPAAKYYSTYHYRVEGGNNTDKNWWYTDKLGEALNEVYKAHGLYNAWYSSGSWSITNFYPWVDRGYDGETIYYSSIFSFARYTGSGNLNETFRNVITKS